MTGGPYDVGSTPTLVRTGVPDGKAVQVWNNTGSAVDITLYARNGSSSGTISLGDKTSLYLDAKVWSAYSCAAALLFATLDPSDEHLPFPRSAAGGGSGAAGSGFFKQGAITIWASPSANQMAGLGAGGAVYTPQSSGTVLVIINYDGTGSPVWTMQPCYGTGTPPAQGAALTGTAVGSQMYVNDGASNYWSQAFVLTGLTLGTQIWVDLQCITHTGGSMENVDVSFLEVA